MENALWKRGFILLRGREVATLAQDPAPLAYLQQARPNNYDLQLDVALRAA